jgi:ribosomal protein S18 acetylase RimI-like enzyme
VTPLADAPPLPDFPARQGDIPVCAERATFRRAARNDLTFLRELYRSFRADEFASLAWSPEQMRVFLDQQFDVQHRYYVATFSQADFLLILREGTPVGRLYLDASHHHWHIVDIGLASEQRNAGLGFAIMQAVKRHAQASAAGGIVLQVACENQRAQRFYRRLGFREVAREEPTCVRMVWTPEPGQAGLPVVN